MLFRSFFNIFVPWGFLIYFGLKLDFSLSSWVSLPFMVLLAMAFLTTLEILLMMAIFVTLESYGINFLRLQLQTMARWPDFVFKFYARKFFTIILPVLLVGSNPVKFLFSPDRLYLIFPILISWLVIVGCIRYFWRLGLRTYDSASS